MPQRAVESIFVKLLVPTVLLTTALVVALTIYSSRRRESDLTGALQRRVGGYATLLSAQVRSAVAFGDRETAREILSSLQGEPDMVSAVLYDSAGRELYRAGTSSPWARKAARGVRAMRVVSTEDRVVAAAPVESLEGPWGTLVIELSTARMRAAQTEGRMAAAIAAGLALAVAVAVSWLVARHFARRIRAIARVALDVERGRSRAGIVPDRSTDEIGLLARSFNRMLRQLDRERRRLESAIVHLRATEKELSDTNRGLETRVLERTSALLESHRQLEEQMAQRSRIEIELRQAQKLESVGRLAAGVAHEINTPVQFVADSCAFLESAVPDLAGLLEAYRAELAGLGAGAIDVDALRERLAAAETTADAAYVLDQMPRAVRRALDGLERVATIVRSLKEFAHPERKEKSWADVNRAVQAVLDISRNEYKYVADLHTDLGELPTVLCHVGELNQAVLNVVINAAHAVGAVVEGTDRRGAISVVTRRDGDEVVISVSDTGTGIAPEILDKIFDPFFTTKVVGQGTGQGLAIVRSVVVDKHGGRVDVTSEPGVGTTFHLRLPIEAHELHATAA